MTELLESTLPEPGDLVFVRSRRWLVDDMEVLEGPPGAAVAHLACAEDDAQGETLSVLWNHEIDRRILRDEGWNRVAEQGFDDPRHFAAFVNTLRWNSVTATDPNLFQSPFRAGIKIDAYQMEPLRKALRLPRVNLFIADDTGLGKTIEAGLIARELLLRKKAKTIVVAAPPSVLEQWRTELEERFGLAFEILDRQYFARVRRERGFGVNPWRTHSRFLVSHNLLVNPDYAEPMREWLGRFLPSSLLILDEAHHAAPSSGGKYGIESKLTRAIRDLGPRFEHRLFLSATPHNGHSNSFSTLLELLDPYRFTRGVKVQGKKVLDEVMVRRLKEDIRQVQGGFPLRKIDRVVIDGLPDDAPELELSRLLDEYRTLREKRFAAAGKRTRAAAGLLVVGLQQRLLSSIEAFARSLKVHRQTVVRQWEKESKRETNVSGEIEFEAKLFSLAPDADDERADLGSDEAESEESDQIAAVTAAVEAGGLRGAEAEKLWKAEQAILERMTQIADAYRHELDPKARYLVDWIRENLCPGLPDYDQEVQGEAPKWNDRRVIIFTENREGTKRYLREVIDQAIAGTELAERRIEVIDGLTRGDRRGEIQRRFNTDPSREPLRILLATDAAREGLNFQAHCTDLFHFDLPWNPGRIEQRNGRIDRKLQPADEVRCHYFVLPQRVEDRVLDVLVRKTETIRKELGSLSKVIDDELEVQLKQGIRHADAEDLARRVDGAEVDEEILETVNSELEESRDRQDDLRQQIDRSRRLLETSRRWVNFEEDSFRNVLSSSLELNDAAPLVKGENDAGRTVWSIPDPSTWAKNDPSWATTLDSLREPRPRNMRITEWRHESPIRPVVFEDAGVMSDEVVHLHLEQRVVSRLLSRFSSQGFVHHDISRACMAQSKDSIPRVVLLGRLSLFGSGAERLHEELVTVAARWEDAETRKSPLAAYGDDATSRTLGLLDELLSSGELEQPGEHVRSRLLSSVGRDVSELRQLLEVKADEDATRAKSKLRERAETESKSLVATLEKQQARVRKELKSYESSADQLTLGFNDAERRQLDANAKSWSSRLAQFENDLQTEPQRILDFYEVRAIRVEPVGVVYLWPETN